MSQGFPVLIRGIMKSDVPLIMNSWLENLRKSSHVKGVPNDVYYTYQHRLLEALLPRATVYVAADPEDPDTVYGWACVEVIDNKLVFHYIYVKRLVKAVQVGEEGGKRKYKGWGMGTALVKEALKFEPNVEGIVYTAETIAGKEFMKRLYEKDVLPDEPVYNPFLLYSSLPTGWGSA